MGGATLIQHKKRNVTEPPMRQFQPPNGLDLSPFDLIISFGDSMMQLAVGARDGNDRYYRPNTEWYGNPWE
jgi:hypothetical protein